MTLLFLRDVCLGFPFPRDVSLIAWDDSPALPDHAPLPR
jgi:hypothetical protein